MLLEAEMNLFDHLQLAFLTAGLLFLILRFFRKAADHLFRHSRLIFYNIRTGVLRRQRHLFGTFQAAVMVYARFGNN